MFEGPFDDKFKQIGNAVSPIFSRALAEHVGRVWDGIGGMDAPETGDVKEPIAKSISSSLAAMKRRVRKEFEATPALAA